ncbi:LacI family DNA-binding transcriptional regulator [Lachnospiraceae bacterium LCP25S3_G4]
MNIKELAKEIGVSSATISRVINNSGYVSEETRKKVLWAVEEYQYVPNAIARSLSTRDTHSIGVIIPDIENEFFSSIISGISEVAEENGYNIHFMGSNENSQSEHAFLETVAKQRLAGVIITPVSEEDSITREKLLRMQESGIPVILVDRDISGAKFEGVFVDNLSGAYDGVSTLIEAGHKKIAIITGPETSKPGKERLKGYKNAMEQAGLSIKEEYIISGDFKIEKAYQCTEQLLQLEDSPTAIFSSNNLTTMGCLKYFTKNKIEIGRQISIVSFDDIEILKLIEYKLSVVARDAKQQGREAMHLMLKRLNLKEVPKNPVRMNIPYQVLLRGSEKMK